MRAKQTSPILLAAVLLLGLGSSLTQAQRPARLASAPRAAIVVNTLEDEYNSDGDCSPREAIAAAGDSTLVATYSGDGSHGPSSATAPHTVNAPQPRDTITTITADAPDPSQPSEVFTVTFQVTAAAGTPTGYVVVEVSGRPETCTGPLSGGGGSCELSLPAAGDYTLVATYSGDADFDPSSDTEPHTVRPAGEAYLAFLPLVVKR